VGGSVNKFEHRELLRSTRDANIVETVCRG
jgi:hypothetical protein